MFEGEKIVKHKFTCCLTLSLLAVFGTACSSNREADKLYDNGMSYMEAGKYEDAAAAFEEAIQIQDDEAEYYISYGMALTKAGDYEKAVAAYQNASELDAKKEALRGQGIAYFSNGQYGEAIECFNGALEIEKPEGIDTDIRLYLAKSYEYIAEYDNAKEVYNTLIDEEGKDSSLYVLRAGVLVHLEEYEASIADYDEAIKLSKNDISLYLGKWNVQVQAGQENANDTLNTALGITAKTDEQQYQAALAYYYLNDNGQAVKTLDAIKESYHSAYVLLGDIYYNQSDFTGAASNYESYIEKEAEADTSEASYKLSNCYINQKNYKKAIVVIEEALGKEAVKEEQNLRYNQILSYEYNADFDQAYLYAKEYVEEYPSDEAMQREFIFLQTRYNG